MKPVILVEIDPGYKHDEESSQVVLEHTIYCDITPLYMRYMDWKRDSVDHSVDKAMSMQALEEKITNGDPGHLIRLAKVTSDNNEGYSFVCVKIMQLVGLGNVTQ